MMGNFAAISGFLVKDGRLRNIETDHAFVDFSVRTEGAYFRNSKIRQGNNFHRVVVYGEKDWLQNWLMQHAKQDAYIEIKGEIRNFSKAHNDYPDVKIRLSEIVAFAQGVNFPQLAQHRGVS